jgi:hypothetical protein
MIDRKYIDPGRIHISPAFTKLMAEMFDRGMAFELYQLRGEFPGLYLTYCATSGWTTLTIGDYENGLRWSL